MGTCIGKRNLKYFLGFLFLTSLHALVTAVLSGSLILVKARDANTPEEYFGGSIFKIGPTGNVVVALYSGIFSFTLACFGLYTLYLALSNVTSNENIRSRWNSR